MECMNCGKQLTGRQTKWCSTICNVTAWNAEHPESASLRARKYQASDKGKQVQREREYKDSRRSYKKDYMKTPKGKEIIKNRLTRRTNRKLGVDATLTLADWRKALAYFDNKWAYCGELLDIVHQEHFIPLSKGGGYTKNNIVPACKTCNQKKRNLNPLDWLVMQAHGLVAYVRVKNFLETLP